MVDVVWLPFSVMVRVWITWMEVTGISTGLGASVLPPSTLLLFVGTGTGARVMDDGTLVQIPGFSATKSAHTPAK
jgi:hypothetical protein